MSQLDRIEEKLDVLTERVANSTTTLGRYDERLQVVEKAVEKQGDRRWSILGYVLASGIGVAISRLFETHSKSGNDGQEQQQQ